MSKGIYCFVDKKNGIVVYIGRFTGRKRIKAHYQTSMYNEQVFNKVLQNNPDRYEAKIICEYSELTNDELNYLEIKEILKHKFLYDETPKFNFTIGGDGISGFSHTNETKQKMSENNARYWKGKKFSDKHKQNLSKNNARYWEGKTRPKETSIKMSMTKNTTGYLFVSKKKDNNYKQGFKWLYSYREDGKRKSISAVNIEKLEKKVKAKGLEWRIL